jgi:hypothetical protein
MPNRENVMVHISGFALWRHHAKLKKIGGKWVDDGSAAEPNNNNWEK